MWGVESTRAPSVPRNVMATSLVTSNWNSPLAPIGMFAIRFMRPPEPPEPRARNSASAACPSWDPWVDLVFHVDAARVAHFLELLEDGRERKGAVADIALA